MLKPAVVPPPLPPGEDDLPYDDGEPVESDGHRIARETLVHPLRRWLKTKRIPDMYVAADMAVYFSQLQVLRNDFRGEDRWDEAAGAPRGAECAS